MEKMGVGSRSGSVPAGGEEQLERLGLVPADQSLDVERGDMRVSGFVLPGSEIERNVWFKDTLSATGIRPRTDRQTGPELLQILDPQAATDLEHAYQAVLALG